MTTTPRRGARGAVPGGPRVTERQFQAQVERYARLCGWLVYHTAFSVRSPSGFPDLVCVRDGRLAIAELKSAAGRLTPAQEDWLAAFGAVPGVTVRVWRPTDEDWAEIEATLR